MSKNRSSGTRKESEAMAEAHRNNFVYELQQEREFQAKWGHLDNLALHRASFEYEMLGFRLRHMLWNRRERPTQTTN